MKRIIIFILSTCSFLMASTIKISYRATNTALTITNLNSLANSTSQSTGIWCSASVDNTTNLDVDEIVTVKVTSGAASVSSTGSSTLYFYGCIGGTTVCTDGVSGSEGTATLTNPTNLNKVYVCNVVANATAYTCGPNSVANIFGGTVPAKWGVCVQNLSGAAFAASGNSVVYDSIQMTSI